MLLAGLWCATVKPPSFSFLKPLFNALCHRETKRSSIAGQLYAHAYVFVCVCVCVDQLTFDF